VYSGTIRIRASWSSTDEPVRAVVGTVDNTVDNTVVGAVDTTPDTGGAVATTVVDGVVTVEVVEVVVAAGA
jgi:hypothetical protein